LPSNGVAVLPGLVLPKSTGSISLASKDPFTYPFIDPNYLSHPADVEVLVEAIKFTRALMKATAFEGLVSHEFRIPSINHPQESDEYIRELIRRTAITIYHPTGTCKMGSINDPSTVVDSRLRVKGVRHLRVIDASIMPTIPSGNTNAPTIMIAEKASDLIKQDESDRQEMIKS